jgi:simple sugar transport system ATP-binding protein
MSRTTDEGAPREGAPESSPAGALELLDIHKEFGPVRANDGVSLRIEPGTVHGLLGENGAGKSTLMKILSGYISADSGEVRLGGRTLTLASPRDAMAAGIGMLHQDPLVFLPFSVLDNFMTGSPGGFFLDRDAAAAELSRTAERFGFSFDPDAPARSLTVGERQQLEIVRLLSLGAKVLILDEPTSGITAEQRVKLFETLRSLSAEGMIVIFVSHKLEEVEDLCDRVTVLGKGRVVGEAEMPVPAERLVEMMFGRVVSPGTRTPVEIGGPLLELAGLGVKDRGPAMEPLDLVVREGEVLGLAGLEGSGQRTLLRACAGLLEPTMGTISVGGRDLTGAKYREFCDAGVSILPAGRLEEGLVAGLTISEHLVLTGGSKRFRIDRGAARERAGEAITEYSIRGRPDSTAEGLSGGNQQRLLLAMLPPKVRLLLLEQPTRGLDVESAAWVWTQLLERREQGAAIVFASADLDEVLRYSDRIAVFFAGSVLRVLDVEHTTGEQLGHLIGGKDVA